MGVEALSRPPANGARVVQDFDWGWRFIREDAAGAEAPGFDDGGWRSVDLPHDWSIEGPFREDDPSGPRSGYLPCGIGWYRKTFSLPEAYEGRKILLEFEGVYRNSTVWINGRHVGGWPYGYTVFGFDLTAHLVYGGQPNVVAVRVDNSAQPGSRWYTGSGIYRHVRLHATDALRVPLWGIYITTPRVTPESAAIRIRANVANGRGETKRFTLATTIVRDDGVVVGQAESEHELDASRAIEIDQSVEVAAPRLWSTDDPRLHRARTRIILEGAVVDECETTFGIRDIQYDPQRGFLLNGKPVKMKGVCLHHDLGCLGAACFDRAVERQVDIMIEMGANAIRTSHNPPAPHLLDYCDRRGILVMDEAFDEWTQGKNPAVFKDGQRIGRFPIHAYAPYFAEWAERDLGTMIARDRNHPCVVLWSIGNEIPEAAKPEGAEVARRLVAICHKEDPTRPVTAACNNSKGANESGFMQALDVGGYNYKEHFYAEDHAKWPERIIIGTETSSATPFAPRGVYRLSDLEPGARGKQTDPEFSMKTTMENDYVAGMFIWTGFDYIGEPSPQSWPSRSSYYGPVDLCGFPKDSFYFYQAHWTGQDVLHLLPHWNWPGEEGREIPVWCYTNCDSVELFLNGRPLGVRERAAAAPALHLAWKVAYEPGTLRAVGRRGGKIVCGQEVRTTGAPARLVLKADREAIADDARDLVFLTASVVDAEGLVVPTASNAVTFRVEGEGRLLGVDNGDPTDVTGFQKDHINALSGLCLAVVQSTRVPGEIRVTASAPGLESAGVRLRAGSR